MREFPYIFTFVLKGGGLDRSGRACLPVGRGLVALPGDGGAGASPLWADRPLAGAWAGCAHGAGGGRCCRFSLFFATFLLQAGEKVIVLGGSLAEIRNFA